MHIPDGYLSPASCAVLFGGAAPFWYVALRRLKRALTTRLIPLISVFAAFSFIVMMFNLPLPGGTTGHATGAGIAAIVLGPWASMAAISIALGIQAVFFGDGGITAIGANCFNMAIIGSLVAYGVYRLIAGRTAIESPRRVAAAAIGGYIAINASALLAGVELGVQPMLYRDAAGAPLYAPYPLHIAIPAMMIGHLTIAGIAEAIVSAGVVAWLQKTQPNLLGISVARGKPGFRPTSLRQIGYATAALMILTPLGILAAGSAWGEWAPSDFANPSVRQQIAASSAEAPPPTAAPAGLARLSSFWTAPMPRYAPPFLRSAKLGYLFSAMTGAGLVILMTLTAGRLMRSASR